MCWLVDRCLVGAACSSQVDEFSNLVRFFLYAVLVWSVLLVVLVALQYSEAALVSRVRSERRQRTLSAGLASLQNMTCM